VRFTQIGIRLLVAFAVLPWTTVASAAEHSTPLPQGPAAETSGPVNPIAATSARGLFDVGDRAPDFSYLGTDGDWHALRGILAGGDVLLVFGARDQVLEELESVRSVFLDMGVQPVAVLDMNSGSAARHARRLDLGMQIISDGRCAIGDLYGALDPSTRRHAPGYFVVDASGTVRAFERGTIPQIRQLIAATARGLARPLPASAWLLSQRD
jgi:peroxiredoxin